MRRSDRPRQSDAGRDARKLYEHRLAGRSWTFADVENGHHPFAWVEIGAGVVMAACFAVMWVTAIYQMWFMTPPEAILKRMGGGIPLA